MGRSAMLGQICGGSHHHVPLLVRHRNGNHVLLDHLTEPDTGIKALGHDVEFLVRDRDVEADVRISCQKTRQQRAAQEPLGDRGDRQAHQTTGPLAHLAHGFHSRADIIERRAHRLIQPLPGLREMNTAGRALNQRHAHPLLKPANGLADSGAGHA